MGSLLHLMRPKWLALGRPSRGTTGQSPAAILFFVLLGALFWYGIYQGSTWLCVKCLKIEDIGELLLRKVLSMAFLTFFSILIFSNLVTAFSTFFLADDLQLLNSAPVSRFQLFCARLFETTLHASWMIIVFGLPFFLAYGQTFQAGSAYYVSILFVMLPFVLIPSALSLIVALVLATVFPAQRTRDILLFLSVLGFVVLILYFRALQPERFLNPDQFSEAIELLGMLRDPVSLVLPSDWAVATLFPLLSPKRFVGDPIYMLALYSTAAASVVLAFWIFEWLYAGAYSKAQTGQKTLYRGDAFWLRLVEWLSTPFPRAIQTMLGKELRTFLRNPGQWSQLLLLGALVVVYVLNFSSLRALTTVNVQGVPAMVAALGIFLFNLILLGFVISAVAVRFAFPAVSLEGRCFWMIRQSPMSMRAFLQSKFWSVFLPLILLSELMAFVTNLFIRSTPTQMVIAAFAVLLMTIGVTGMGVGLGATYPRFEIDNPAKIATGFGGVLFMICSMLWVGLLIVFVLVPMRYMLLAKLSGATVTTRQYWLIAGVCVLSIACTQLAYVIPMRVGQRVLERLKA